MNFIKEKPHYFLLIIPFLYSLYLWLIDVKDVDIQMHDNYFVIASEHIASLWLLFYALLAFIYWLTDFYDRRLDGNLTLIHVCGTVLLASWLFLGLIHSNEGPNFSVDSIILFLMGIGMLQILLIINLFKKHSAK